MKGAKDMSLNDLSNIIWYSQPIIVKENNGNVVFNNLNYMLQSVVYKHLVCRLVRSVGVDDGKMIIILK